MSDDKVKDLPIPDEGDELPSTELIKHVEKPEKLEVGKKAINAAPIPPATGPVPEPDPYTRTNSSKCIYFSKAEDLHAIENVAKMYPKVSVSYIVQQLVRAFNKAVLEQTEDHPRAIPLKTTIYL